jgi:hypothetical protein
MNIENHQNWLVLLLSSNPKIPYSYAPEYTHMAVLPRHSKSSISLGRLERKPNGSL